jgi:hypothetical protein
MAGSQEALDRFERQTAWPMMALALAIIPLLVVPLLVDLPSIDPQISEMNERLERIERLFIEGQQSSDEGNHDSQDSDLDQPR